MSIKSIAYFPTAIAMNGGDVLTAFLRSCRKYDIKPLANNREADCAVIWSSLWNGRMKPNKLVYDYYKQRNKPVLIIEVGALKRNITWKMSVDHVNALGYYGHTQNLDPDRPKKLGISLGAPTGNNGKILIASQHQDSAQVQDIVLEEWISDQVLAIKEYTNKPIVIRPHPRSPFHANKLKPGVATMVDIEKPVKLPNTYDSFDLNYNWHTIVNYCSGPGIQGAINGVPVLVDKTSLAYPVSINVEDIDNPPAINKEKWFIEIAHTEYTLDEIENGLWYERLQDAL